MPGAHCAGDLVFEQGLTRSPGLAPGFLVLCGHLNAAKNHASYFAGEMAQEVFMEGFLVILAILAFLAMFIVPGVLAKSAGAGAVHASQNARASRIARDMEERGKELGFTPDKSFISKGLAFDTTHGLFYIGIEEGRSLSGGIYPFSSLLKYSSGHDWVMEHQKFFLDLTVKDINNPSWRIWFGGDHALLAQVTATIDVVWASK